MASLFDRSKMEGRLRRLVGFSHFAEIIKDTVDAPSSAAIRGGVCGVDPDLA